MAHIIFYLESFSFLFPYLKCQFPVVELWILSPPLEGDIRHVKRVFKKLRVVLNAVGSISP